LIDLLIEATEQTMRHLPSFISANIHRRSREDFDAMVRNQEALPHMKRSAELATFEPILCDVSYTEQG
jgi:hypothetical protein